MAETASLSTTPFGLVAAAEAVRPGTRKELLALSRTLELAALADPPDVVAAALQDVRFLSDQTRRVYADLARAGSRAVLHARGMSSWLAEGVIGIDLDDDDPLVDEWVVVVPSQTSPVVFAATDLRRPEQEAAEGEFSYAISRDPEVVRACAALLAPPTSGH